MRFKSNVLRLVHRARSLRRCIDQHAGAGLCGCLFGDVAPARFKERLDNVGGGCGTSTAASPCSEAEEDAHTHPHL